MAVVQHENWQRNKVCLPSMAPWVFLEAPTRRTWPATLETASKSGTFLLILRCSPKAGPSAPNTSLSPRSFLLNAPGSVWSLWFGAGDGKNLPWRSVYFRQRRAHKEANLLSLVWKMIQTMARYLAILAVAIQVSGAAAFVGTPALSTIGARTLPASNSRDSRSGRFRAFYVRTREPTAFHCKNMGFRIVWTA